MRVSAQVLVMRDDCLLLLREGVRLRIPRAALRSARAPREEAADFANRLAGLATRVDREVCVEQQPDGDRTYTYLLGVISLDPAARSPEAPDTEWVPFSQRERFPSDALRYLGIAEAVLGHQLRHDREEGP